MIKINDKKLERLMTKELNKYYKYDKCYVCIDTIRIIQPTDTKFNYDYCLEGRYGIELDNGEIQQKDFTIDYINKNVSYNKIVGMFLQIFNMKGIL